MSKLTRYVEQVDAELSRYIQLKDHNTLIRLGEQFTAFLMNNSKSNCDARNQGRARTDSATLQGNDTRFDTLDKENSLHWTVKDIQQAAAKLKYYVQESRTEGLVKESDYLFINNEIASRVHQWVSRNRSDALWIEGPAATFEPTQNTLTAAFMFSRIRSLRIPVISYFCVYEPRDWQTFSRSHELLKMVYSLIYQVCSFLPEGMSADDEGCADISPSRVEVLGHSVEHLPEAIQVLGDLLRKAPSLLFCILDGVQLLDKEEDPLPFRACLRRFVHVMHNVIAASSRGPKIGKLGFFTDGMSWKLRDAVNAGWLESHTFEFESGEEPMVITPMGFTGIGY